MELLLRSHPEQKPALLKRPLEFVKSNRNVLISTPDDRPLLEMPCFLSKNIYMHTYITL